MRLSERLEKISKSATLHTQDRVKRLQRAGNKLLDLTSGQLPFRPVPELVSAIATQMNFLASFQYSAIKGFRELRHKLQNEFFDERKLQSDRTQFDTLITSGSKQGIYHTFGSLVNPGDKVLLIAPYWVSFPEMIQSWGGTIEVVTASSYDNYVPDIYDIEQTLKEHGNKLTGIVINSPNNPTGIHYPKEWMDEFAQLLKKFPDVWVMSDEVYDEVYYFDPAPYYFYQCDESLLKRTIIVRGISKSMAATGLRIGFVHGPIAIIDAIETLQSQTIGGANSLLQRALLDVTPDHQRLLLKDVKVYLRQCSQILMERLRHYQLANCWYQTTGAFYFMLDFSRSTYFQKYYMGEEGKDYAQEICDNLLEQVGVAVVPSTPFGMKNGCRLSLTLEMKFFEEAVDRICRFLACQYDSEN